MMEIVYKQQPLTNLDDWGSLVFSGKKKIHWKKERSAYSLANFILNQNGIATIQQVISPYINEDFNFETGSPEFEARFDNYGHGREHDFAIWGRTASDKKIFVSIEAKVDETFGDSIALANKKAIAKIELGQPSNTPKRIEELLKFNFEKVEEQDYQLRYQLLFSTAGTLCIDAEYHLMLVLVFKTESYNTLIGKENFNDLMCFLERANAVNLGNNAFHLSKANKQLTVIYKEIEMSHQLFCSQGD